MGTMRAVLLASAFFVNVLSEDPDPSTMLLGRHFLKKNASCTWHFSSTDPPGVPPINTTYNTARLLFVDRDRVDLEVSGNRPMEFPPCALSTNPDYWGPWSSSGVWGGFPGELAGGHWNSATSYNWSISGGKEEKRICGQVSSLKAAPGNLSSVYWDCSCSMRADCVPHTNCTKLEVTFSAHFSGGAEGHNSEQDATCKFLMTNDPEPLPPPVLAPSPQPAPPSPIPSKYLQQLTVYREHLAGDLSMAERNAVSEKFNTRSKY